MNILLLLIAQYITVAWSLHFNTSYRLRGFVVVNMLLVLFLWSKMISIGGVTSSIGSLFYSTIFLIQTLIFYKEGKNFFLRGLNMSLFNFAAVCCVLFFVVSVPTLPGNESYANAVNLIANEAIGIAVGAFLSFYVAQFFLLHLLEICRDLSFGKHTSYIVSVAICSMVESLIFSVILFGVCGDWFAILWWSWILKMLFTLAYIPIISIAERTYFKKSNQE